MIAAIDPKDLAAEEIAAERARAFAGLFVQLHAIARLMEQLRATSTVSPAIMKGVEQWLECVRASQRHAAQQAGHACVEMLRPDSRGRYDRASSGWRVADLLAQLLVIGRDEMEALAQDPRFVFREHVGAFLGVLEQIATPSTAPQREQQVLALWGTWVDEQKEDHGAFEEDDARAPWNQGGQAR